MTGLYRHEGRHIAVLILIDKWVLVTGIWQRKEGQGYSNERTGLQRHDRVIARTGLQRDDRVIATKGQDYRDITGL